MPLTGGKKSLKPDSYRRIRHESDETRKGGAVSYYPLSITGQGVLIHGEVNRMTPEAEAKATCAQRRKARGASWARQESSLRCPKPVDLCLPRLKPSEREVEGRTRVDVQITGVSWA